MLRLVEVAPQDLPEWSAFTYPFYRPRFLTGDPDLIGVAAHSGGHPVGFALASVRAADRRIADLLSVSVAVPQRRRGYGAALLGQMEEAMRNRSCIAAAAIYMTNKSYTEAVEGLLDKAGWSEAERRMLFCESDFATITKAPWMAQRAFPDGYEPFLWSTLSPAERQGILDRQCREQWYPETLTPFWMEDTIEPVSSLGLRYGGEIVGWCISHRVNRDTIRFARLFVRREFQGTARAIPLLAQSIYRHENTEVDKAIFDVAPHNDIMLRFVERRMKPYLLKMYWTMQRRKLLTEAAA